MLRGIVFDLFHTLVDPEDFRPRDAWRLRTVAEAIDVTGRDLIMFWKDTYLERTTSPVSGTELIVRYAAENEIILDDHQINVIDAAMGDYQDAAIERPRADVLDAVAALSADHPLTVLSNCYLEEVRAWPRSPLARLFDGAAFSYAIGHRKPSPEAYLAATDLIGVEPAASAFVGNGASNELLGAQEVGFALVVHQNQFNSTNGLVTEEEQRRRAGQADAQINALSELEPLLR